MASQLRTKDLLNLGIFATIYAVIMAIAGIVGASAPLLVFVTLVIATVVNGTVYMLYLTRVDRFGMVLLLALLMGIIMIAVGRSWTVILTAIVCGLLAELILAPTKYTTTWANVLSYVVFSLWVVGPLLPIIWFTDGYFASVQAENGADYAQTFVSFFTVPMVVGFAVAIAVSAVCGGILGTVLIRKHFMQSGTVSTS